MSTIAEVGATDTELVRGALAHDQASWNELVERYTRLVWYVVNGFGQLDHERRCDVHQTVWLRLAERLDSLRNPEKVGGWLATTARNECLRQLRHQAREVPAAEIAMPSLEERPERRLIESERDRALWGAFAELDHKDQQLLRLLIADPPFSYDEIAEILDMRRGSIGPTRQRCLAKLRKLADAADLEETP